MEVLEEAGMPAGRCEFLSRRGSSFGDAIVKHPKTRFIAFTGSRDVGLGIHHRAAAPQKGQIWIKRTILEMGGKDAIIVDSEADVDSAVEGVAQSAFGFQGQKCSACSRAIVDEKVYDQFVEKLKAARRENCCRRPTENATMCAVINESAMNSILEYIEVGKKDGRLLNGGGRDTKAGDGYFIQPTVIADVLPTSASRSKEIFGPVLAVIKSKNYDDASPSPTIPITASLAPSTQNRRKKSSAPSTNSIVGNLYINRKCTGAMVGAHPFGGFNMSGTDSKAGGADYLYLFTQAKSIGQKIT